MITGESLGHIPLFRDLPQGERESIAARAADIRLRTDEWLLREGETAAFHVVVDGHLALFRDVGGHPQQINSYKAGEYFGEVPLLLGSPALGSVRATETSRVIRLGPGDFLHLITKCPTLNGEILRTMATRVGMLQRLTIATPIAAVNVTGPRLDPACHEMRDFLVRNHVAFEWIEPETPIGTPPGNNTDARDAQSWPLITFNEGPPLTAPSLRDVAKRIGLPTAPKHAEYDVLIAGGGPAGLACAVYGASEGLRTLLIEQVAPGGQAGTSSRIENYLGFPTGVSGDDLSLRAREQAVRFGAEVLVTRTAAAITSVDDGSYEVTLDGGERVRTSSVVLATGVQWRRLNAPGIDRLLGRGVYYGASQVEALGVRGRPIYLVGGGNSAGQAAMLFSSYAEHVTVLVRGEGLAESMSQYLIDQLAGKDNITIETQSEVVDVAGEDCLERLAIVNRVTRAVTTRECAGLFVFIGARPMTEWLPPTVIRDQWSYVCTGRDVMDLLPAATNVTWPLIRDPYLLETSAPGVFAAGDVRHGSIKRVASSVGEGSMAIAFVHQYLAERKQAPVAVASPT